MEKMVEGKFLQVTVFLLKLNIEVLYKKCPQSTAKIAQDKTIKSCEQIVQNSRL